LCIDLTYEGKGGVVLKVAIVGCGGLGQVHADCYAAIPGVQVVGVHDLADEHANRLAVRANSVVYDSFDELLERSGCDLVSVTLPSHLHKSFTVRAASFGKHVICEKPIALNLQDAKEMIRVCQANNVRLFIGHVVRFFPEYVQMKQKTQEGALGRIGVAHAKRAGGHPGIVRAWYREDEKSGGVIGDLMIHDIDFMRWTLGEVRSVYGLRRNEVDFDYALATLVFKSGAVANLEAFWGYPGPFVTAAEIAGSKGVIRGDSTQSASLQIRKATESSTAGGIQIPQSPSFVSPYTIQLSHFVDCIRNQCEPIVSADDAYLALEIALAVTESSRSGNTVTVGEN
jgi:UDP-N-acetylglucosamine 3-dehydrogenase